MAAANAEEEKLVRNQAMFGQKTMAAVAGVTMLGSFVTDTGTGLNDWLTTISMFSMAATALLPILAKVGATIKASQLASNLGGMTSGVGGVVSKAAGAIKGAASAAIGAMMTPMGLGITAAVGAGIIGVKLLMDALNASAKEQAKQSDDIVHSTDMWAKALGKTKATWGQVRTAAGEVKDTVASLAKMLQTNQPDLVNMFRNVSGDKLLSTSLDQALRMKGAFGMNKADVENNMRAVLTAAGKSRKEIEDIIGQIDVRFDFADGIKDLDTFTGQAKNRFNELKDLFANPANWNVNSLSGGSINGAPAPPIMTADIHEDTKTKLEQKNNELSALVIDSLAGMDDEQQFVFAKMFADSMAKSFTAGLMS